MDETTVIFPQQIPTTVILAADDVAITVPGPSANDVVVSFPESFIVLGPVVPGPRGLDGQGWTPILAVVASGPRHVMQVTDWTGGLDAKPPTGVYVGPTGFVALIADAADITGTSVIGEWLYINAVLWRKPRKLPDPPGL